VVVALRVLTWIPRFIDVLDTRVVVRSRANFEYFKFTYFMIFRSDFFICERCESIPSDSDAKNDDHKWWHSLLVLRKTLIEPVLEPASNKVEATGTKAETQSAAAESNLLHADDGDPGTTSHSALISAVVTRISAVEDKLHVALTAIKDKVDSTKGQLSSIEERVEKLDDIEERVVKLDGKIAELTKMLGDLIGRLNI
jgi:hypothetical protein